MNFTSLDIVLLIPLVYGLAKGAYRGLIGELSSVIGLVGGLVAAFYFSDSIYKLISKYVENPGLGIRVLAFFLVFISVIIAINFLGKAIKKALDLIALGAINHIFGAAFGFFKWVLICSVAVYFFASLQKDTLIIRQKILDDSIVFQKLLSFAQYFASYLDAAAGLQSP
jgi:membrane protein required for colicin V production